MGDSVTYPAEVARQWKKERDEARAVASKLFAMSRRMMETGGANMLNDADEIRFAIYAFYEAHPWLTEEP
jgi:hypothetical protein